VISGQSNINTLACSHIRAPLFAEQRAVSQGLHALPFGRGQTRGVTLAEKCGTVALTKKAAPM